MNKNEIVFRERIWRRLRSYLRPGMAVLDAGCGPGAMAEALARMGCQVTAVDLEPKPEWEERSRLGIKFIQASAEALDFNADTFDAVLVMDALHHMENPEKGLAELARVAKPAAPILVVEGNRRNPLLFVRMTLIAGHQTFSRSRLRSMLRTVDPHFDYFMIETRCLPWSWSWLPAWQNWASDLLERARFLDAWLTYQIGILRPKKK